MSVLATPYESIVGGDRVFTFDDGRILRLERVQGRKSAGWSLGSIPMPDMLKRAARLSTRKDTVSVLHDDELEVPPLHGKKLAERVGSFTAVQCMSVVAEAPYRNLVVHEGYLKEGRCKDAINLGPQVEVTAPSWDAVALTAERLGAVDITNRIIELARTL